MRILGIDPGYAIVGYGAVDYKGNSFSLVNFGAVTTPAGVPFERRLISIAEQLDALLDKVRPDAVAIEKLYFNTNTTTAIDVAQARGVTVYRIAAAGVPIFEYTPLQVKSAVVGYGRAEKKQVMEMTRMILGLEKMPRPDDAADALAIAICHAHTNSSLLGRKL